MRYYAIPPGGRLKEFVSHFWVSEFEAAETDVFTWLSTADSCAKMVFFYHKGELSSAAIQGHTQTHGRYPNSGSFGIFGVTLFSPDCRLPAISQKQDYNVSFLQFPLPPHP